VLPWDRVDEDSMRCAITRTLDRCQKARQCALDGGSDVDWHRWRRRVRRLGQQHGVLVACDIALAGLLPPRRRLANLLGESQDFSVLIEHLGNDANLPEPQRQRLLDHVRGKRDAINREIRNQLVGFHKAPIVESDPRDQAPAHLAVVFDAQPAQGTVEFR
jgi:hypothetical protein